MRHEAYSQRRHEMMRLCRQERKRLINVEQKVSTRKSLIVGVMRRYMVDVSCELSYTRASLFDTLECIACFCLHRRRPRRAGCCWPNALTSNGVGIVSTLGFDISTPRFSSNFSLSLDRSNWLFHTWPGGQCLLLLSFWTNKRRPMPR